MNSADRMNRVVWVTASGTALDHAVAPRNARFGASGNHVAVCGSEFRSAPLVTDPGRQCVACILAIATGDDRVGTKHCHSDEDDGPIARWWNSFRPLNLVSPVASQRATRRVSPGEESGNRVWWDAGNDVPRPSCPASHRTLTFDVCVDPDTTERRYPVAHFLRHWDDSRATSSRTT